ncbi:MAG: Holliday junction branch migration protein RuvA [Bacteroidales bacterium]|nr:Holliday junction branch migration protein RuvA [Bacteroidales bacterium]
MYAYISGKLIKKTPAFVIVDVQGVGYHINISLNTFAAIGNQQHVKLFTHLSVKEDAHILYGFHDVEERSLFLNLISVSGVGANTARIILSSLNTSEAIEAISGGNVAVLQRVKGIGTKTAQRIVVDLKDKVSRTGGLTSEKTDLAYNTNREEALSALLILGFNKAAVEKVLARLLQNEPSAPVEKLIKEALKVM